MKTGSPRHPFEDTGRTLGKDSIVREAYKPVEINFKLWPSDVVDEYEAVAIRNDFADGQPEDLIAASYGIPEEVVNDVLAGRVWPYTGGKLKPLFGRGPNVTNGYTANQRKFIKGVIGIAYKLLNPSEFSIFCSFNSMGVGEARNIADDLEDLNARLTMQRYRRVLRLHAEGSELEKAFVAVAGKTRHPTRE